MPKYRLGYKADDQSFLVCLAAENLPGDVTSLGTFDHDDDDDPNGAAVSHTLIQHVRDILYKRSAADLSKVGFFPDNVTDLASVKLVYHGDTIKIRDLMGDDGLTVEPTKTLTLKVYALPYRTAVDASLLTFVSDDTDIATVDTSGVVTGVAEGEVTITATLKADTRIAIEIPVTVAE